MGAAVVASLITVKRPDRLKPKPLNAQREAREAYIYEPGPCRWKLLLQCYDDCDLSSRTLDRPALQRLLTVIEAGLVDVIVVYKVIAWPVR